MDKKTTIRTFRDFGSASRMARAFRAEVVCDKDEKGPLYSIRRPGNEFLTEGATFVPKNQAEVAK